RLERRRRRLGQRFRAGMRRTPRRGNAGRADGEERMRVLIAIDFGTARSGYAFAYADEREVPCRVDWPDQPGPYLQKLSQMLYGPGDELIAWGYSAPKQLALRRRSGEPSPYRLVRAFKMKIKEGRPSPRGPTFVQDDRSYYVLDLIADYLRQLK